MAATRQAMSERRGNRSRRLSAEYEFKEPHLKELWDELLSLAEQLEA